MKSVKWSRRSFLRTAGAFGAAAVAFDPKGLARIDEASQSMAGRTPEDVAQDEFYWREIQLAFKLDRSLINLNNGFTAPMPRGRPRFDVPLHGDDQHAAGPLPGHGRRRTARPCGGGWPTSSAATARRWP
ncbi:MAG: twin-arginine translocation signal domain-containing protein [Candidatus Moduliflexus flocculans]|nr:twin-arginine translocation signal domain-containing protein [Candidatus Moduliflexus flocculans]